MSRVYDVVVVGAGPAGATAARLLSLDGFSVLLLDGKGFPRDKPCGGGLTPRAWRQLGVAIDDLVLNRATSVQVRAGGSFSARFRSEGWAIWMVRRRDFDLRLAEAAQAAGAEFRQEEPVVGLEPGTVSWVETTGERYGARVVIGADGAESRVSRWLGLAGPERWMVALEDEIEVAGDPLRGDAIVDFGVPRGYAWVFPKGDVYNVGIGTFDRGHAPRLKQHFGAYVEALGLPLRRPPAPHGRRIPTGVVPGPLHSGSCLLVGDAAGVADPFYAEGISYALLTARLAAVAVSGYLGGNAPDLSGYTGRVRETVGADARLWLATAAVVHRFPALSVRLLASSGRLRRLVERTIAGDAGFARLGANC